MERHHDRAYIARAMRHQTDSEAMDGNSCAISDGATIVKGISTAQISPMIRENMICPFSAPSLKTRGRLTEDSTKGMMNANDIFNR